MRLFIIGVGPLPFYKSPRPMTALSDGAWQIIQPLLEDGHKVRAVTMEFGQREAPVIEYTQKPEDISPNFEHQAYPEPLRESRVKIARQVQQSLAAFHPDAIISAGSMIAAWVATQLRHQLPLWYDLKGAFTPELQLRMESPDAEATFETFAVYKQVLLRGDRFSAVTQKQADMVMGELGMTGRLNPANLKTPLVSVKPTGIAPDSPSRKPGSGRIRGRLCDDKTFVLFSSGGFNTWQDTSTFFKTIERVLMSRTDVCFVCIGGGIGGHHDLGYRQFADWSSKSPARDRIFLEGWVPQEQVVEYESEADLGLNFDLDVPESHYGDRSRFLSWIARGVGVATTAIPSPSKLLVEKGLAIELPVGDWAGSAGVLHHWIDHREELREMTARAEKFVREEWSYRKTTESLREWAANPVLAEDNREWFFENKLSLQFELASHELSLDYLFAGPERRDKSWQWMMMRHVLAQRWPWMDGRKWWRISEDRDSSR